MRFNRWPREAHTVVTKHRVAAANRRVARDKAERASLLFPELKEIKYETGAAYIEAYNHHRVEWLREDRERRAGKWRQARSQLFAMPAITRQGIVRYWKEFGCPGDPEYLLDVIRSCKHVSGWTKLRRIYRFRLISAGKLPRPEKWSDL
jgi:hypothetical protein